GSICVPGRALKSARPLRAENTVKLLHRELANRIVLIDEDANGIAPARNIQAPGDDGYFQRVIALIALKKQGFVRREVPAGPDIRETESQRGNSSQSGFELSLEANVRVKLLKAFFPHRLQSAVGEIIRAPLADHAANFLLGVVSRQIVEFPLFRIIGLA